MDILTHNQKALKIFQNFVVDETLPKHQLLKSNDELPDKEDDFKNRLSFIRDTVSAEYVRASTNNDVDWAETVEEYAHMLGCGHDNAMLLASVNLFWLKLKKFFGFSKKVMPVINKPQPDTINQIFANIITSIKDLQNVAVKNKQSKSDVITNIILDASIYSELIKQAKQQGQVALAEQTEDKLTLFLYETILANCGFPTYITDLDLIKAMLIFDNEAENGQAVDVERCLSGFQLTWLKNFTRFMPLTVTAKKKLADKLMIFDNYVVMHYDTDNISTGLTKEEKVELAKDPILFGVIEGSHKLYFIDDWIDEFCDLTFKEISDKLQNNDVNATTELAKNHLSLLGQVSNELLADFDDYPQVKELAERWLLIS